MSQPIKNREAFFDYLEEGLQDYFDHHDRLFGGIIHLTVGVREGKVGGIIKSADAFGASVATATRYDSVACDERNFSSSEERALAPLGLPSQRSAAKPPLYYSGFTLDRVRKIIAYVLPKYVPRTEVALITDSIIEELRMGRDEPEPPKRKGRPKKQNTNTKHYTA